MFFNAAANISRTQTNAPGINSKGASASPAPTQASASPVLTAQTVQPVKHVRSDTKQDRHEQLTRSSLASTLTSASNVFGMARVPRASAATTLSAVGATSLSAVGFDDAPHPHPHMGVQNCSFTELLARMRILLDHLAKEHARETADKESENLQLKGMLASLKKEQARFTTIPEQPQEESSPKSTRASRTVTRPVSLSDNRDEDAPAPPDIEEDVEDETHGIRPTASIAHCASEQKQDAIRAHKSLNLAPDDSLEVDAFAEHGIKMAAEDDGLANSEDIQWLEEVRQRRQRPSSRKSTRMSVGESVASRRSHHRGTVSQSGLEYGGLGFDKESLVAAFKNVGLRKSLSFADGLGMPGLGSEDGDEAEESMAVPNAMQLFPLRDVWVMKEDQVLRSHSMRKSIHRSLNNSEHSRAPNPRESVRSAASVRQLVRSQVMYKIASISTQDEKSDGSFLIIHPQASIRFCWDLMGIIMIGYDIFTIPLQLFQLEETWWDILMSWVASIYWTLDIVWSLRTGVYIKGVLELRATKIAARYFRTWFAIDLLIVLPEWFSLISGSGSGLADSMKGLRAMRTLRFLRLLRLVKVERIIKDLEARINSNYFLLTIGIAKLISGLVIVNHLFACLWYGMGVMRTDGWVNDSGLKDASLILRYMTSIHWSLTQFHGTMEIYPRNLPERAFSVGTVLIALILFSSFLSSITNLMIQLQSLRSETVRQNRVLRAYLQQHQISQSLSVRVKKFIVGRTLQRQERDDEVELLRLLPEDLLMDLHEETRAPALAYHAFFCDFRSCHRRAARQLYHAVLIEVTVIPSEVIFSDGDVCGRMLFIESGVYRYKFFADRGAWGGSGNYDTRSSDNSRDSSASNVLYGYDGVRAKESVRSMQEMQDRMVKVSSTIRSKAVQLSKGEWCSEAVLWTPWENIGELKCAAEGNLLALPAQEFADMIQSYPGAHLEVAMYARAFVQSLHDSDDPSDLLPPPIGWNIGSVEPEAILRNMSRLDMGETMSRSWSDLSSNRDSARDSGRS